MRGPATPILMGLILALAVPSRATEPISSLEPGYEHLVELQRRGRLGDRLTPGLASAPLPRRDDDSPAARLARGWTSAEDGLHATLRPHVTLIGWLSDPKLQLLPLHLDVRDGDAVDPFGRARVAFRGRARLHERVSAGVDFAFDSRGDNDPRNRTRSFEQLDASNNFDAAWMRFHFERGSVTLGRLPFQWGPTRLGGLLVSDVGPAFDMLHGHLDWGPHVLQAFVGQLSSEVVDASTRRRWLYGHRADVFLLDDRLRLGVSEIVVVAGAGEGLNLRYLNPIPLWAQIQVEDDGDASTQVNAIQSADATWTHDIGSWRGRLYGSLAVDDLQIDDAGRDRNPDQLAWAAGADVSRAAWLFGYEYRRVGSWTYLHRGDGTDHRHFGRPLGAPEGPDTDRHDLRIDWRHGSVWRFHAGAERRRRGENRIATTESREGKVGQDYPRGTVESRWVATVGATWERPGTAKAALQAAFHSITNVNNEPGEDRDVFEARAVVEVFLPRLGITVD